MCTLYKAHNSLLCLMSDVVRIERFYFDSIRDILRDLVGAIDSRFPRRSERIIELLERCKTEMDRIVEEDSATANQGESKKNFVRNSLTIKLRDAIIEYVAVRNNPRTVLFNTTEDTFFRLFKMRLALRVGPLVPQVREWEANVARGPPIPIDVSDVPGQTPGPGTWAYDPSGVPRGGTETEFSDMYTVLNNLHMRLSALESIKVNLLRN